MRKAKIDFMNLTSTLQAHFGFNSFRAGQEEAIQSFLNKNHASPSCLQVRENRSSIGCL